MKLSFDDTTEAEIVQKQIKVVDQIIQRTKSLKHILQYPDAFGFPMLFSITENDNEMFSNQETFELISKVQNIYGSTPDKPQYIEIRNGADVEDIDADSVLLESKKFFLASIMKLALCKGVCL